MTRKEVEDMIAAGQKVVSFGDVDVKVGINLHGADLSGVDLSKLDLSNTNFHGADLSKADLSGAKLCGANMHEANLAEADLSGADMSCVNLHGADLTDCICDDDTKLDQANLASSDRTGMTGNPSLKGANLYECKGP